MKHQKKLCYKRIILLLNLLLIIFSTILRNSIVYADDYDYLPVGDVEQYNAYRFWQLYGYNLDYTNTISYTSTQSGTFTYTGTVSGSLNGQETASYNISLSGDISTLGQGSATGVIYESTGNIYNWDSNAQPITLHLVPKDNAYENNMTMACEFNNPVSHTYNNDTGWQYDEMSCTVGGGYEPTTYDLDLRTLKTGEKGVLTVSLNTSNSGSGGLSGTVSLNSSESVNGSGSITLNGTESTTGHKIYDIPVLSKSSLQNNFNVDKQIENKNDEYIICFLSNGYYGRDNILYDTYLNTSIVSSDNEASLFNIFRNQYALGGYFFNAYSFNINGMLTNTSANDNKVLFKFKDHPFINNIIPIYCGYKNNMSDKLYRYIFGSDRTNELLDGGTDQSKQATNNLAGAGNSLTDSSDQLHEFEQDQKDNMNNALNNIDLNFDNPFLSQDVVDGDKAGASIYWVKKRFDQLINPTPIRFILIYSLTIGLALTILGKLRNR